MLGIKRSFHDCFGEPSSFRQQKKACLDYEFSFASLLLENQPNKIKESVQDKKQERVDEHQHNDTRKRRRYHEPSSSSFSNSSKSSFPSSSAFSSSSSSSSSFSSAPSSSPFASLAIKVSAPQMHFLPKKFYGAEEVQLILQKNDAAWDLKCQDMQKALHHEYDKLLNQLLQQQFEQFSQFNHDYLDKNKSDHSESYIN